MKCPLCDARKGNPRKGKRRCPVVGAEICAPCCGDKRLVEIDCPESCSYLAEGQRAAVERDLEEYMRLQEPAKVNLWASVMRSLMPVVDVIEQAIVDVAAASRELTDEESAEALGAIRQGYQSEAGGIIYQPSAISPRVQMLMGATRESIEALRTDIRERTQREMPADAIAACLQVVIDRIEYFRARKEDDPFVLRLRRLRKAGGGLLMNLRGIAGATGAGLLEGSANPSAVRPADGGKPSGIIIP